MIDNNSYSSTYLDESSKVSQLSDYFFNGSLYRSSQERNNNSSIDLSKEIDSFLYDVPAGLIALLSFFYGSISILAVLGNSLVMWIVATSRRMQNVTNCFIANLALADILIGLFAIPFQFQAALLQRWNLPYFMCPLCPFVQALSVNVSVFTLTAIAVDRHRAILYPLSARPSKRIAKIIIGCIWLLATIIATPMALALRVEMAEETDLKTRVVYTKPFCVPYNMSEESMVVYRMVLFFLQYLTPLCVISFVYARMALRLWGSKAPGNAQDSRDANLMKNKKKVIKMLVIVVALFALCWLPLHTYQVLQTCFPLINEYRYINIVFFCCDWLAMSNSCYNPIIYGIYNEKFKREFRQRFPCCREGWRQSLPTDSYDMDKNNSIVHTRHSSLRSTYDWRRSTRHSHAVQFTTSAYNRGQTKTKCLNDDFNNQPNRKPCITTLEEEDGVLKTPGRGSKNSITFNLDTKESLTSHFPRLTKPSNGLFNSSDESSGKTRQRGSILQNNNPCCKSENGDNHVSELYVFPGATIANANHIKELEDIDEFST